MSSRPLQVSCHLGTSNTKLDILSIVNNPGSGAFCCCNAPPETQHCRIPRTASGSSQFCGDASENIGKRILTRSEAGPGPCIVVASETLRLRRDREQECLRDAGAGALQILLRLLTLPCFAAVVVVDTGAGGRFEVSAYILFGVRRWNHLFIHMFVMFMDGHDCARAHAHDIIMFSLLYFEHRPHASTWTA